MEYAERGLALKIGSVLLLILLFPKYRLITLAVTNLAFGLLAIGWNAPFETVKGLNPPAFPWLSQQAEWAALYLMALLFFYLFALATIQWTRPRAIAILIGTVIFCSVLTGVAPGWFGVLTAILMRGLFYNAFYLRTRTERAQIRPLGFLSNQAASFSQFLIPMPPLMGDRLEKSKRGRDLLRLQWNGIQLALLTLVCAAVLRYLEVPLMTLLAPGAPPRGALHEFTLPLELYDIKSLHVSLLSRWLATFSFLLLWMMREVTMAGLNIAACRMVGVDARAPVYDLLGAKSLYQFFERYNPYYCRLILEIFVYPIFRSMNFIANVAVRLRISFVLGIVLCGLISHHVVLFFYSQMGFQAAYPSGYASTLVYWVLIAMATGFSFGLERKPARPLVKWRLQSAFYFLVTSILFIFIIDYYTGTVSLEERTRFVLGLFGF